MNSPVDKDEYTAWFFRMVEPVREGGCSGLIEDAENPHASQLTSRLRCRTLCASNKLRGLRHQLDEGITPKAGYTH